MLIGLSPLLNADVLHALRAMGHGDELILADANFPADSLARQTTLGKALRMDNVSAAQAARAILSLYPLDTFAEGAAGRMEVVGDPHAVPQVQMEVQAVLDATQAAPFPLTGVERFAFYERAKKAYCIIQTGERRFYGCFALRKGVVPPDGS